MRPQLHVGVLLHFEAPIVDGILEPVGEDEVDGEPEDAVEPDVARGLG